jgi:monoamine oxidase
MPTLPDYAKDPEKYTKEDYLTCLTTWPYKQRKKRVAIVGAGISGLTAGWLLRRAGHDIKIFEANNIVGGRIKTLRDRFTAGFYAEAGAMRIPHEHELTIWMIKQLLKENCVIPFRHKSPNSLVYFNHKVRTLADYEADPDGGFFHFSLTDDERKLGASTLFKLCVENYVLRSRAKWEKENQTKLPSISRFSDISAAIRNRSSEFSRILYKDMDRYSFGGFLAEQGFLDKGNKPRTRISQGGIDFISAILVYEMHLSMSMAAVLSDFNELEETDNYWQIVDGMDNLPRAFIGLHHVRRDFPRAAEFWNELPRVPGDDTALEDDEIPRLAPFIEYNARVKGLAAQGPRNKIVVTWENPVTKTESDSRDNKPFDIVIISIPFSALRHVKTQALMSPDKRRAIRQLHYDNSCKILLEFKEAFWMEGTNSIEGGRSITDLPIRQIHYPSPEQFPGGYGVLLASYTWGEDSLRWTSLRHDDRIRFALRNLERIHDLENTRTNLERLCTAGVSHSWAEQEFTSGAFAMFEPYQLTKLFEDVWRPEGRIHYCGEHTSTKHGWIEGAIESGIRVTWEICDRVDSDPELSKNIELSI